MGITEAHYDEVIEGLEHGGGRSSVVRCGGLPWLGSGSARSVFLAEVDGAQPHALKVLSQPDTDVDGEDHEQMIAEVECLRQLQGHPLVPTMLGYGPEDEPVWVEVELLTPLSKLGRMADDVFEQSTGVPWIYFRDLVRRPVVASTFRDWIPSFLTGLGNLDYPVAQRRLAAKFLSQLADLTEACKFAPIEFNSKGNWGADARGRLKLLDLGVQSYPSPEANPDRWGRPANLNRIITLNLGLGRDSMTMLVLASQGKLKVNGVGTLGLEDLDYVVFSDTGKEFRHTYDMIPRVRKLIAGRVPFHVLAKPDKLPPRPPGLTATGKQKGRLDRWPVESFADIPRKAKAGGYHYRNDIFADFATDRPCGPTFPNFSGACTTAHKIGPMRRLISDVHKLRFGLTNKQYGEEVKAGRRKPQLSLIGIAADETTRIKTTLKSKSPHYAEERMPLVDMGIAKADEAAILGPAGFGDVRKSGCVLCPYQPPSWWWAMSIEEPEMYAAIVANERRAMRRNDRMNVTGVKIKGRLLTVPEVIARWRSAHPDATVDEVLDKTYEREVKAAKAEAKRQLGVGARSLLRLTPQRSMFPDDS